MQIGAMRCRQIEIRPFQKKEGSICAKGKSIDATMHDDTPRGHEATKFNQS